MAQTAAPFRLMTLDPGHFHAALFQKEMLSGVADKADVYAPMGPDLIQHLNRISQFNNRAANPTRWKLEVHAGQDFLERMFQEKPGNIVVLSGKNNVKMDRILAAVGAGLHVLADKPWIIEPGAMPRLERALNLAESKGVVIYDAMTERFEISYILQKELVNTPAVFGTVRKGTQADPAVSIASSHYLLKEVSGAVNLRPPWFFDIRQQGEALADVGTHFVEHAQWALFPGQAVSHKTDAAVLSAARWPTVLSLEQFQKVTSEKAFPPYLDGALKDGRLEYFCNNSAVYTLRGVHVKVEVTWNFEAAPGVKDELHSVFRGSRAIVELRQTKAEGYRPEIYVKPVRAADRDAIRQALRDKLARLKAWPGVGVKEAEDGFQLEIPDAYRVGHEAHFASVCRQFLEYAAQPKTLPAWEKSNMLAKYHVTTQGIELARKTGKP